MPRTVKTGQGTAISARKLKEGAAVAPARRGWRPAILKDIPPGHRWGWYSREDPRMHLQSVDEQHFYKIWLEKDGKNAFEPVGKIPVKTLKVLRTLVDEKREFIADNWVRFMIEKSWLDLHKALPKLTLVAYPNTPNKFKRVIDLTTWLRPDQLTTLKPEIIELNRDMAALRLWTNRPEEQCYDVRLSRLLWGEPEAIVQ